MYHDGVESLYCKQNNLWKKKDKIEIKLIKVERLREDIEMEKSIIESDLVQEVGFTKKEFDARHAVLFVKETNLDDEEHNLGYELYQIENTLSEIFLSLSHEFSTKVA